MLSNEHSFNVNVVWQGASEKPHTGPKFSRKHSLTVPGLPPIESSAARIFHGDADRWNPEQLLIAAVAQCHMMTFLFLARREKIIVVDHECPAEGVLTMDADGVGGSFTGITLRPQVTIVCEEDDPGIVDHVNELHEAVGKYCFIARSVTAPILVEPTTFIRLEGTD